MALSLIQYAVVLLSISNLIFVTAESDDENVLRISTPSEYELFQNGRLGNGDETVYIKSGAHPNLILHPIRFWNTTNPALHFVDAKQNSISIYPSEKKVNAFLRSGADLTQGIPTNYKLYSITFTGKVDVTTSDIHAITEWKDAAHFAITDNADVAYDLSLLPNELQKLTHLESFLFKVQKGSFLKLKTKPFLTNLPALKFANFRVTSISYGNVLEFAKHQETVEKWNISVNSKLVSYKRR